MVTLTKTENIFLQSLPVDVFNNRERDFLEALLLDYAERGRESFLTTLFNAQIILPNNGKEAALELYGEKNNIEFINKSYIMFEFNDQYHYIGKKGSFFFMTNEDREFIALGREIQNLPYYINFNEISLDIETGEDLKGLPYYQQRTDYVEFCHKLGLKYCSHLNQDFQNDILILDKEEVLFFEMFNDE